MRTHRFIVVAFVVCSAWTWPVAAGAVTLTGIPALRAMVGDGLYQRAIEGARTLLTQQVSDPVTLAGAREVMAQGTRGLALQARSEGRLGDAVALARGLVDALPNQPESFALLAETLSAAGQRAEADTALQRAMELGSASAAVHRARGIVMADRGELGPAVAALRKAVALAPGDLESQGALARSLALAGRLAEAIEAQRGVVKARPLDPVQRNRLALLQLLAGDLDGVEATLPQAVTVAEPVEVAVPTTRTFRLLADGISVTLARDLANRVTNFRRLMTPDAMMKAVRLRSRVDYPLVVEVVPGSQAEKAGIRREDLILSVQGTDLYRQENAALMTSFTTATDDGSLSLVLQRRVDRQETKVTVIVPGVTASRGGAVLLAREAEPQALRSRVLLARGAAVRALRAAEDGLTTHPDSFALRYSAALAYRATAAYHKVLEVTAPLSRLIVDDWLGMGATKPLERAIAFAHLGKVEDSLTEWAAARAKGGLLPCAFYDRARAELRSALDVDGLETLVRTSSDRDGVVDALRTLRKLAWTPAEEAAVRDLALAWGRRQRPVPGLPEEARNRLLRMQVFLREKDAEAAGREIAAAIDLAPWEPSLYYNAALVAAGAEDYRRAVAFMTTYVGACPTAPDAAQARDQMVQWGALADRKDQGH